MIRDTFDIDETKGIVLLTGEQSIVAQVTRRLRYFRGEFWLNPTAGIPWDLLLGHRISPNQLGAEIVAEIGQKEGVESVVVNRIVLPETKRAGVEIDMEIEHSAGTSQVSVVVGN